MRYLVLTRYAGMVPFLRSKGVIKDGDIVVVFEKFADAKEAGYSREKLRLTHIIGSVPAHISAQAAMVTQVWVQEATGDRVTFKGAHLGDMQVEKLFTHFFTYVTAETQIETERLAT